MSDTKSTRWLMLGKDGAEWETSGHYTEAELKEFQSTPIRRIED